MEGLCLSLLLARGPSRQAGLLWALGVAHAGEEEDVLRPLRMRPLSEEFYTTPKTAGGMTTASLE